MIQGEISAMQLPKKKGNNKKQNKRHKHLTINQPKALNTTKDSKNLPCPPHPLGRAKHPFIHFLGRIFLRFFILVLAFVVTATLSRSKDAMGVPRGILTPPPGIESISHPLEMEKNHQLQKMCDFWKGSYVSSQEDSILKLDLLV